MKHLFLINPAAGKRGSTDSLTAHIHRLFTERGLEYEIALTEARGQAEHLARAAAEAGGEVRIYACGGDGTLNEVVNGAAGYDHVAVTNVPKGTGNDFLKIFGPDHRKGFCDLMALAEGPQAAFDLMNCNGKLGVGVICAGVDARVAADVDKYKPIPLVRGPGAYIIALVENVLFKAIARPTVVDMGDLHLDEDIAIICICNGRYYGGGFMPVGDAEPDDGVLDMLVVPKVGRVTFARLVGDYAKGKYRDHPEVIWDHHGQSISFSAPEEMVAVVDGEVLRDTAFRVFLDPRKINFFYPSYLDYHVPAGTPDEGL